MGVVALPSRVTGLAAISISEEITFMPGCHASSNSSQYDLEVGVFWRLILRRTDLFSAILSHLPLDFRALGFTRIIYAFHCFIEPLYAPALAMHESERDSDEDVENCLDGRILIVRPEPFPGLQQSH